MFCIINITMNILLQDKTLRCSYKWLICHKIRYNTKSLWFFNTILLVAIQILITFHPPIHAIVGFFVIKLKVETPPQMQQHIQHYQSVLAIARWDTSSCYFFYSKPFILWNLCLSHQCHLWFNLEMILSKPNRINRINGYPLFQEYNFVWFSTVHRIKIGTPYPHHCAALISTQDCKVKF